MSTKTGRMIPASCKTYSCPVCGPRKARRVAGAASWVVGKTDRARFVTLTLAPEDWQQRRQKVRDLRRLLTRRGYSWETFWACERGALNGMLHVHGIQHGSYVPQGLLQDVWGARVDIRKVGSGSVAGYVLKDAARVAGYAVKGAEDSMRDHLGLNGGRAAHWSRGFLLGRRLDEVFAEQVTGGDEGPWVLMTDSA